MQPIVQFVLRPEGLVDIAKVIMDFSDDILDEKCELMPPTEQSMFYIEARLFFHKNMVSILNKSHLLTKVIHSC